MIRMTFLAAVALTTLAACTHIDPEKARNVQLSAAEMTALQGTVANDFPDPKSVEFRNIRARDNFYPDGTTIRSVCGEVRGKGPFGNDTGFIGFTRNLEDGKWIVPTVGQPCY